MFTELDNTAQINMEIPPEPPAVCCCDRVVWDVKEKKLK
jgi:hypothetical protein